MKFGLLFAHQIPPESGIPWNAPYQDMLRCLPRAEELGYTSAFQVSHHVQKDGLCPGPLVALGAAAAVTQRMRIGTGILLVPLYAPLKLAEDVAVLDNVSNGRLILGVAPGYVSEEFAAHGVPRNQRVGRFEESLDLMTLAWREERFSFDGRYYRVPEAYLTPKPVQKPHPPIWYGVSAPASIRRAARRRAVLLASPRHGIGELKEHFRIYEEAANELGFRPPERPVMRQVFVAETRKKAEEIAAPAVSYLYRELYGAKSAEGERELRTDDGRVITDRQQATYEALRGRYAIGDPDHVRESLKSCETELGATEIICWMHMPGIRGEDAMRSVEIFAKEVMPRF